MPTNAEHKWQLLGEVIEAQRIFDRAPSVMSSLTAVPGTGERERLARVLRGQAKRIRDETVAGFGLRTPTEPARAESKALMMKRADDMDAAAALLSALAPEGGEPVAEWRLEIWNNEEWVPRDRWLSDVPQWAVDMVADQPNRWRLVPLYTTPPRPESVSDVGRLERTIRLAHYWASNGHAKDAADVLKNAVPALDAHVLGGEG